MNKIITVGKVMLASAFVAPMALLGAQTASAQPTPAPADVCFDGPYPSPPPPWGPGTMTGCVNPDNWFDNWGWRYDARRPNKGGWKYVGPGCEYQSNPNWRYEGPDCARQDP